jgi:lipoprotein-anchoring transpeptidase ErfK/SrfK
MGGVRVSVLIGAGLLLAACAETATGPVAEAVAPAAAPPPAAEAARVVAPAAAEPPKVEVDPVLAAMYASRSDGERSVPALDVAKFDARYLRQQVAWSGPELPGTIVIDTGTRHLYFVEAEGTATRYGVAIGREGFGWTGEGVIGRRAQWPRWTPPPEMIGRDPTLERWKDGMPGGPQNPLGARALYIYFGENDSQYRVHGTNEPFSIGRAASSGCFRMLNQDVMDLYARVENGARIVVR